VSSRSYAPRSITLAAVQAAILLLCFGSGLLLDHFALPGPGIVVLAMVLGLTLGRSRRHNGTRQRLAALITLPLIAVACTEIGRLFFQHPTLADTLFTLGLGLSIWLRRFGPWGLRIGSLIATPFLAVLVTPVPVLPGAQPSVDRAMLWSAVASVIAFLWVWIVQETVTRLGLLPMPPTEAKRAAAQSGARIPVSDRMAAQMVLSLALAFVIGRSFFSTHWTWIVITAFIVNSGNRGRGDVAHKSVLRVVGASVGTVAATLLSGLFPPGDSIAIVAILILITLGNWLRTFSYTYWAGCVTAVLALLQGYFGHSDVGLIGERLLQIVLGGALSVAVAWFVLPVKSRAVLRRRIADCLAPLTDALVAARRSPGDVAEYQRSFEQGLAALAEVAPTFTAHRRLHRLRRAGVGHPADAIDAVQGCAEPLSVLAAEAKQNPQEFAGPAVAGLLGAVTGNVVAARRFIGRRPDAHYRQPPDEFDQSEHGAVLEHSTVIASLRRIDEHMRVICEVGWGGNQLHAPAHGGQESRGAPAGTRAGAADG
jgi:hypothetical protein